MPVAVYAADDDLSARRLAALRAAGPEIDFRASPTEADPAETDYLLYAPNGPVQDLRPYAHVKAILSLWAGVEALLRNPTLPAHVPVARMVEPGLTVGMTDYIVAQVMRVHIGLDQLWADRRAHRWIERELPLSNQRTVGVLGLGVLGADAAQALSGLRFQTLGWSRNPKTIPGVQTFHGESGLETFLSRCEIVAVLLPLTAETTGLLNARRLSMLPRGAHIVNAARGPIIDDSALIAALDDGQVAGATLDVFTTEPLPPDHPYWRREDVLITPHCAAATRSDTAAKEIVAQIRRAEAGEPIRHLVNRTAGY